MNIKKCTKCKIPKELTCFRKERRTKVGYQSICKACEAIYRRSRAKTAAAYNKKYRAENAASISKKRRAYYLNNKETLKAKDREYRERNKEHIAKKKSQYYRKNKKSIQEKRRQYPTKYSELRRAANKKGLGFNISFSDYKNILADEQCYYCDHSLSKEAGHSLNRIDSSKGYILENVKPCCGTCNRIMSNFTVDEFCSKVYKIAKRMKNLEKERQL